ncbi:MAG: hypothetical protein JO117_07730, partial [Verrucomicrobia bacterium]|nr:hypothetical protein [Verrucomicrobiota bacterium]
MAEDPFLPPETNSSPGQRRQIKFQQQDLRRPGCLCRSIRPTGANVRRMLVAGLLVVGFGVPAVAIVRDAARENELEVWARRMALRVMRLRWPSPTTASAPAAPAVAAAARGVPAATTVGDNNNHSHRSQSALAAPAPVVTHPWEEVYATRRAPVALSVPAPPLPAMAVMTRHTFSSIPMSPAGMAGAPPTTARS